jgi:hypothetical protein
VNAAAAEVALLDGRQLSRALRAGFHRVLRNQEHLNKINVFPVPDGDTGTNLALTLGAVLSALRTMDEAHAGRLLVTVADASLDGARGNSGAILAQFFVGLSDQLTALRELSTRDFAAGVESGARYAREALSEPREGTLLTVLSDFAAETGALARAGAISASCPPRKPRSRTPATSSRSCAAPAWWMRVRWDSWRSCREWRSTSNAARCRPTMRRSRCCTPRRRLRAQRST